MSEWKRHRGSKSMPKCLEGKEFEVRLRSGDIVSKEKFADDGFVYQVNKWLIFGSDPKDVLAYRILPSEPATEPAKPDYSNGYPEGTTAKDIGAKVGDEFVVVGNDSCHGFNIGDVVKYHGGNYFLRKGESMWAMRWRELAPIPQKTDIELQAEEVGIPEPVQYVNDGDTSPECVEKQDEIVHMPTTAPQFLQSALSTLTQRGKDYDKPEGERSASAVAVAFNAITGKQITDAEVYLVLQLVKDVRQWQCADFHADSALDCVAYAALKAEALCK